MDVDIHGPDIHRMLGLEPAVISNADRRFEPVPYSSDLKMASIVSVIPGADKNTFLEKHLKTSDIRRSISSVNWGRLDYLFVDTPAGPGEELSAVIRSIFGTDTHKSVYGGIHRRRDAFTGKSFGI